MIHRRFGFAQRRERPEAPIGIFDDHFARGRFRRRRRQRSIVGRSFDDPLPEERDGRGGQLVFFVRHARIVFVRKPAVEDALVGLAGNDRRAAIAAFQQRVARREIQPAFNFLAAMTAGTRFDQDRPNPLERRRCSRRLGRHRQCEAEDRDSDHEFWSLNHGSARRGCHRIPADMSVYPLSRRIASKRAFSVQIECCWKVAVR